MYCIAQEIKKFQPFRVDSLRHLARDVTNPTLRIIKNMEPKPNICCLCCVDVVSELTTEERLIILSCGFARQNTTGLLDDQIILLCVQYVGQVFLLVIGVAKSEMREVQNEQINEEWKENCEQHCCCLCLIGDINLCDLCIDCLTSDLICRGFCPQIICTIFDVLRFLLELCALVIFLGISVAKDTAALIVWGEYDCSIAAGNDYVHFDINEWILYGSIINLIAVTAMSCWVGNRACGMCECPLNTFYQAVVNYDAYVQHRLVQPGHFCLACCVLFWISWVIIGFLLYGQMSGETYISNQCKDMVLSWSILQAIQIIIISCDMMIFLRGI